MIESKVNLKIDGYKPQMHSLPDVEDLELDVFKTILMVKADGEFTFLAYSKDRVFTVNRYGHLRMDYPALNEFAEALRRAGITDAGVLCELYAVSEGKPLKLPQFIHYVKSHDPELIAKVHIGVWDLVTMNGHEVHEPYIWKMEEVAGWLRDCRLVHVLPYIVPTHLEEVREFWKEQVEEKGWEGLVARTTRGTFKIKPSGECDAVIIGINKKKLLKQQKVTSIKLAVMDEDGCFIELSDCASGINHRLREVLYKLLEFKVGEDRNTVYVQPLVVVTVEYTETFQGKKRKLTYGLGYHERGRIPYVSLRHPRLTRIRSDKKVNPQDLRLTQIPL